MYQHPANASPENTLKAVQLLTVVLTASPITFGVVAVFLALGEEPQLEQHWAYAGPVGTVLGILLWLIVPGMVASAGRHRLRQLEGTPQEVEERRLGALYQLYLKRQLISLALLEAIALLNIMFFLLTTQPWLLALSSLPIAMMAASFPWRERVELWVQEQSHLLDMNR
jgi:hypothetical protein